MARFINSTIDAVAWDTADRILAQLPVELHTQIMPRVLRKAIKPVVDKGRELLHADHDSSITGTADKQSAALKAMRAGLMHLWETVTYKTRTYDNWTTMAFAGPSWPAGNLMNFWSHDKQHYLWGPTYYGVLPMFDSVQQAAEQTEAEQSTILVSELIREVARNPLIVGGMATGNASFGTSAP